MAAVRCAVPLVPVDDATDPRLAPYRAVSDPALAREHGLFVAEGRLVVDRLLDASAWPVQSLLLTPPALDALGGTLQRHPDVPVYLVPQSVMNGVAGFPFHRGCLALGYRRAPTPWEAATAHARLAVGLEHVGDADNVGAVFRAAAAFGADAVLIGPHCADPLYRKAIRTSMGAVLEVPFAAPTSWPDTIDTLRAGGWAIVATTPARHVEPLRGLAHTLRDTRTLLLAGHEGDGLAADTLRRCTHLARIPTTDRVDSLNVAVAAAIALYEWQTAAQNRNPD